MHIPVPAPHLARVGDTVASPIGRLAVLRIRIHCPWSGHPLDQAKWARQMDFRHVHNGTFHTTWLPEPDPPDYNAIGFLPIMYGNADIGYTLLGPLTTPEEGLEQARAEALLTKKHVDFAIDGIVVVRFTPDGTETEKP